MAKVIMVQGTTSNAGKSLTVAALCRIFRQDGLKAAPFKSQNMALNSFITADGAEMGTRAGHAGGGGGHCTGVRRTDFAQADQLTRLPDYRQRCGAWHDGGKRLLSV